MNNNEEMLTIGVMCYVCKKVYAITLPKKGLIAWKTGILIQNAFPELDADTRELLISHICAPCFNTMFTKTETA